MIVLVIPFIIKC